MNEIFKGIALVAGVVVLGTFAGWFLMSCLEDAAFHVVKGYFRAREKFDGGAK